MELNKKYSEIWPNINVKKDVELRYGENPHQSAGFYTSSEDKAFWSQLQGKKLSYNNYSDIEAAYEIVEEFQGMINESEI